MYGMLQLSGAEDRVILNFESKPRIIKYTALLSRSYEYTRRVLLFLWFGSAAFCYCPVILF
jgi:hypothetical protein